jgi:drug/metabolite transporter (DMT)-like permease
LGYFIWLAAGFYTLYAVPLLKQLHSLVIVGWAMVIGGCALSFIHPPWKIVFKRLPLEAYFYLFFVILFETMIAFWFYIEIFKVCLLENQVSLGSLEPLSAVLTTVFWLKDMFGFFQWLGLQHVSLEWFLYWL